MIKNKKIIIICLSILLINLFGIINKTYAMKVHFEEEGIRINVTKSKGLQADARYNMEDNPKGMFQEGIFCIQHGQTLHSYASNSSKKTLYKATKHVVLDGERGEWWAFGNHDIRYTKDNVKMAWILCQEDTGSKYSSNRDEYSEKQRAIYHEMGAWFAGLNMFTTNQSGGFTSTWVTNDSENYYNRWKSTPDTAYINNNTDLNKLSRENYTINNEEYVKVGPFNVSYASYYSDVNVIDQDGNNINRYVKFARYNGTEFNLSRDIYEASNGGSDFYMLININSNARNITLNLKAKNTKDKISAEVYILETNVGHQSLLVGQGKVEPNTTEASVSIGPIEMMCETEIIKIDETTQKPLSNVGFTLKMQSGAKAGLYVGIDQSGKVIYSQEKQTLITDSNGKISIKQMYPGNYELIETVNPHYGYEDLPKTINSNQVIKTGEKTVISINNKRKYIDISGYVWEDKAWDEGKTTKRNELYQGEQNDTNDKKVSNVEVFLVEGDNQNVEKLIQHTTTDENGNYKFKNVDIDKLADYYIAFQYNGMNYQCLDTFDKDKENASKAIEGSAREGFNATYETIEQNKAIATYDKQNGQGKAETPLKYNQSNNVSKIILGDNPQYGYEGAKYPVSGVYQYFTITANTYTALHGKLDVIKSPEEIRKNEITEITNINLGLKEREQPDIGLTKDVYKARVQVGNYNNIYDYGTRFNDIGNENKSDPTLKFGKKYGSKSYTQPMHPSDIRAAKKGDVDLSVNVIYEISLKNESTDLTAVVKGLNEYYDTKYELVKVGNGVNEDGEVIIKEDTNGLGDVNEDGKVDFLDAIMTLRYIEGLAELTPEQILKADVSCDGKVTEDDAKLILNYDAEIINGFSSEFAGYLNEINNSISEDFVNGFEIGDVNADGKVDSTDANLIYNYIRGIKIFTSEEETRADFNKDRIINEEDARAIEQQYNSQYKSKYLNLKNVKILPQSERKLYIEFKVKAENLFEIVEKEGTDDYVKLDNIVEIASYGTLDNTNSIYAGIDNDSQPGNTDITKPETWEDDTDKAPGLKVQLGNDRTVTGIVFEDNTQLNNNERKGNGIYDEGTEHGISDIKCILRDANGNIAKLYPKDSAGSSVEATGITDENGNYAISGFLPGKYYVQFEWGGQKSGETTYTVQDYKSTIVTNDKINFSDQENNLKWYVADTENTKRYSTAIDWEVARKEIDNETNNVTNETQNKIKNGNCRNKLTANTPKIGVDIESNDISNINFGIAERPKQKIQLDKYVKEAKITLANGNVLVDAKIKDGKLENTVKYATFMPKSELNPNLNNGTLKIEIDNELILGATLEITYGFKITNISEIDYSDDEYYFYGKNGKNIVTLQPVKVVDYIDKNFVVQNSENNQVGSTTEANWVTNDEIVKGADKSVDSSVKTYIKANNNIVLTYETDKLGKLKPKDTVDIKDVTQTKMLSTATDGTSVENNSEILEIIKTGGAPIKTIPGNYIPSDEATYESDSSKSENVVIVPPTGLNTYIIEWTIIALLSLGILIPGIVLIKKYILK